MVIKFQQFLRENSEPEIRHWTVSHDEEGEDVNQTKYSFKKGDSLTTTSYLHTKDGNSLVNHNGRIYTFAAKDISYFAKLND